MFTGKEFTFASEWVKRKGLQRLGVTAWSMWRKLQSLILPFKKKLIFKSGTWAGHLNTILYPEGREFEQTKLQKLICPGVCPWGECWSFELMDALEGGQIRSLRLSSLIDHVLVVTLVLLLFHRRLSNNKIEGLNATTFACFENLKEL